MGGGSNEDFTATVKAAVRRSVAAIRAAHPSESLCAFALCTDDDLRTVFHVAASVDYLERAREPDVRFVPVDWEYHEGSEFFDAVNAQLVIRFESSSDFALHVEESFRCLVEALKELRDERFLAAGWTLIVTSTDPGPVLEQLADDAMRVLNDAGTYAAWRRAMGRDSEAIVAGR